MPRPRIRLTLTYRVGLLVAVVLIAFAIVTTAFATRAMHSNMAAMSEQGVSNVQGQVSNFLTLMDQAYDERWDLLEASVRQELRSVSAAVPPGLDAFRAAVDKGELTQEQAQEQAKEYLRSIRYGDGDRYFFVYDRDMTAIAHPDPQFEGRNLADMQDADGKYVVRELIDIGLRQGSGFLEYSWVRLGGDTPSPKYAYVFRYEPWDWFIGTGVYVDDINADVQRQVDAAQASLSKAFGEMSLLEGGFFAMTSSTGEPYVLPAGRDLSMLESTPEGKAFLQQVVEHAPDPDGGIVTFTTDAPIRDGVMEPWVVHVSVDPDDTAILVSAVPEASTTAPGRRLAIQQAILALVVLGLGLISGLLVSRRIARPVEDITRAAHDLAADRFDPQTLDRAAGRRDEVGELARVFKRMASDVVARERELRERVARLTIEIDRTKVERTVSEITETEYFQQLQARADELRRRGSEDEPPA